MNNSSYTPSYLHSSKGSLNNNNSNKFSRTSNNGPVKLIEPHLNNFNLITNPNRSIMSNNSRFHQFEMKEGDDSYIISSKNFEGISNKDHYKKDFRKIFNRNLNSNNTNFTNDDSKSFNFHTNFVEENSINISIYEKKREKPRTKTTREINGLNYQDLVDIINRRKLLAEKMKIEKEKNNEINNNYIQDFIEKNDNGVQTSLDYNDEEEDIPQEYPFKQLQRNKSESHAIIKSNNNINNNEIIGELFSSLSTINISSNFKNNTFSNRKTKDNYLEFNVIVNNNNIENNQLNNYKESDKINNDNFNKNNNEKKEYDIINNKNNKKDIINSSEFDIVNAENDESKINNNNNNNINETEFKIENNDDKNNESEFKINENTVTNFNMDDTGLNIENNLDIQKEIFNQFPNPSFISVTTKDDFKIESNLDSIINTDEQEKSSVIESIVNQPSKSLISSTQKNDIEETQLEEYDQDKYRMQNETKEINMSSYMNSLYIKNKENDIKSKENDIINKENDIKNNIDEKKKINYFEETLEKIPKKEIKDKINDNCINLIPNENNQFQLSKRSNSSIGIMKKESFRNNRYENFQPKNSNKNISNDNNNMMMKINNSAITNKVMSKIPIPMRKNSEISLKSSKNDYKITERENKKFDSCVVTLENNYKKSEYNNNNSCKIKNKKKKQRRIDSYSDYYKQKIEKYIKEEPKYINSNNSHEEGYFYKPNLNNSNENSNKINSNKIINNKPNNIYLKPTIDNIPKDNSNNNNELLNKHNKSTYY